MLCCAVLRMCGFESLSRLACFTPHGPTALLHIPQGRGRSPLRSPHYPHTINPSWSMCLLISTISNILVSRPNMLLLRVPCNLGGPVRSWIRFHVPSTALHCTPLDPCKDRIGPFPLKPRQRLCATCAKPQHQFKTVTFHRFYDEA